MVDSKVTPGHMHEAANSVSSSVDDDLSLWALIGRVGRLVLKANETEMQQFGLSGMQAAALFAVSALGAAATPAEISRWLFRQPHSVLGLLRRMEDDGLVRCVKQKKCVNVELTSEGSKKVALISRREAVHRMMSCLNDDERRVLASSLEKLRLQAIAELGLRDTRYSLVMRSLMVRQRVAADS